MALTDYRPGGGAGEYEVRCTFYPGSPWGAPEEKRSALESSFRLTVLARTPERVARVMDAMVAKARVSKGEELARCLAVLAKFGGAECVDRMAGLAEGMPPEGKVVVYQALARIESDRVVEVLRVGLGAREEQVRAGAAGALGMCADGRGVGALLEALPRETGVVRETILGALGASKTAAGVRVLEQTIAEEEERYALAAIGGLGANGGEEALAFLRKVAETGSNGLRFKAAFVLGNDLRQPLQPEWLWPLLVERHRGRAFTRGSA
jgi:hypothetical protein